MTKTFSSGELVSWIRHSFDSQVGIAIERLRGRGKRLDIHGARKQLKHARAELRLLQEALGDQSYRALNAALRDSARPLSEARDAQVLLLTLKALAVKPKLQRKLIALRRALQAEQRDHQSAAAKRARAVAARLARARRNAQKLMPRQSGWRPIATSLERTYRRARKAFILARKEPTAEHLHEWRKQVKYYFHQLEGLERLAPRAIAKKSKPLRELADCLGDDHDLVVLRARINRSDDEELDDATRQQLDDQIDARRRKLQRRAMLLGAKLFDAKPKAIAQRFAAYWT